MCYNIVRCIVRLHASLAKQPCYTFLYDVKCVLHRSVTPAGSLHPPGRWPICRNSVYFVLNRTRNFSLYTRRQGKGVYLQLMNGYSWEKLKFISPSSSVGGTQRCITRIQVIAPVHTRKHCSVNKILFYFGSLRKKTMFAEILNSKLVHKCNKS